ncbi:hypothetical protein [Microcoleus sp. B5-D4]|uniref:hypothetical protein n=1 Tax=Microcoleus sp. B5-D4 TaxID=2818681 RepID=UPI002FD1CC6C
MPVPQRISFLVGSRRISIASRLAKSVKSQTQKVEGGLGKYGSCLGHIRKPSARKLSGKLTFLLCNER